MPSTEVYLNKSHIKASLIGCISCLCTLHFVHTLYIFLLFNLLCVGGLHKPLARHTRSGLAVSPPTKSYDDDDNDNNNNKSAQSNLGRGPRCGGLQPACIAETQFGPCAVGQCAVAFIHEYACYARNWCVRFVVEQSLLFC